MSIYLFTVKSKTTKTSCEVNKDIRTTSMGRSGMFVDFDQISHFALVVPLLK